jgi:hypothetical protein
VDLTRPQCSLNAAARTIAPSKEALDTPLSPPDLSDEPGPATRRSATYRDGTHTRWPDPASRTQHPADPMRGSLLSGATTSCSRSSTFTTSRTRRLHHRPRRPCCSSSVATLPPVSPYRCLVATLDLTAPTLDPAHVRRGSTVRTVASVARARGITVASVAGRSTNLCRELPAVTSGR